MSQLTKDQIIEIARRFTKEMGTPEFVQRFVDFVKNKGAMDPDKLFDELENLQKFLYSEWDIHPDVGPDEMLDQLHMAAKKFPDESTHQAMDLMCSRIQWILNVVGNGNDGGHGAHGHSHNGQPCHGHGGHGHSHGGPGGMPGMPNPMQMQMMQLAVAMAIDDDERAYMAESQKMVMEGRVAEIDDTRKTKMGAIQGKLTGWMRSIGPMIKEQMDNAYQTVLTEEERDFADATQAMIAKGDRPDEARMIKINELQSKVMAYVQTMLGFLQQQQQEASATSDDGSASAPPGENSKEK